MAPKGLSMLSSPVLEVKDSCHSQTTQIRQQAQRSRGLSKGHTAGEEASGDSNTGLSAQPSRSTLGHPGRHTAGAALGLELAGAE